MAEAFAGKGVKLALVAYPGAELDELRQDLERRGIKALALHSDLRDPEQRRQIVERVRRDLGEVEILINNAGVEFTARYHELPEESICEIIGVNLEAAMIMSRLVLPNMLRVRRGHIVNISSLAGKASPAFQEPYAASKAGLIGFTSSLRASYRGSGVSASVIVPGFVEAGIYEKLKRTSGCSAPALLGTSSPQLVARAVLRSVEKDLPEVIVNPVPVRPLLMLAALCPSLGEWAIRQTGGHDFFRNVVDKNQGSGR
jgi:short-subunit dehydrogenase